MKKTMTKQQIIETMKNAYMPNFFDVSMYDYTKLNDDEIYNIYLEEKENYGDDVDDYLLEHLSK